MKTKNYRNLKNVLMLGCIMLVASSIYSCKKSGETTPLTEETLVKINLQGVEAYGENESNAVGQKQGSSKASTASTASEVQEMTVPFGNSSSIDVVLTNSSATTVNKGLVASSGAKATTTTQVTESALLVPVKDLIQSLYHLHGPKLASPASPEQVVPKSPLYPVAPAAARA